MRSSWQIRVTRWLLLAAWVLAALEAVPQIVNFYEFDVFPDWPGGWMQCINVNKCLLLTFSHCYAAHVRSCGARVCLR